MQAKSPRFVIQEHSARAHHFDFRLERDGTFKSWALPKGISNEPGVRRLAVEMEDHDLTFGDFEGEIPTGQYGAGTIRTWDRGAYSLGSWTEDRIDFELHGAKISGRYALVRFRHGDPLKMLLVMEYGEWQR
jgi:bifunctional non-homologous end joining protein LigD